MTESAIANGRHDAELVIAKALVDSHDVGGCLHADVDEDGQCPDCDALFVAQALLDAGWLNRPGGSPTCPECGYRDNYAVDGRWHCRGCGHSWRPGHVSRSDLLRDLALVLLGICLGVLIGTVLVGEGWVTLNG